MTRVAPMLSPTSPRALLTPPRLWTPAGDEPEETKGRDDAAPRRRPRLSLPFGRFARSAKAALLRPGRGGPPPRGTGTPETQTKDGARALLRCARGRPRRCRRMRRGERRGRPILTRNRRMGNGDSDAGALRSTAAWEGFPALGRWRKTGTWLLTNERPPQAVPRAPANQLTAWASAGLPARRCSRGLEGLTTPFY